MLQGKQLPLAPLGRACVTTNWQAVLVVVFRRSKVPGLIRVNGILTTPNSTCKPHSRRPCAVLKCKTEGDIHWPASHAVRKALADVQLLAAGGASVIQHGR